MVQIAATEQVIEYNGEQVMASEFKNQTMNSLLVIDWSSDILIPLAIMFEEMKLEKGPHLKVVNKLASGMASLTHQEFPIFARQLLTLCAQHNLSAALLVLQTHFESRVYNNATIVVDSENLDAVCMFKFFSIQYYMISLIFITF